MFLRYWGGHERGKAAVAAAAADNGGGGGSAATTTTMMMKTVVWSISNLTDNTIKARITHRGARSDTHKLRSYIVCKRIVKHIILEL